MAIGKVKWFNNAKGYGFVVADALKDDLFAHWSSIVMEGYKTLKAGQDVEFEVIDGPKGKHAVNIKPSESNIHVHLPDSGHHGIEGSDGMAEDERGRGDRRGNLDETSGDLARRLRG
ncbi:MAG: cold shock domain protein CspD [Gammaproteobacteria bacterium]|nr:cold shock domain protein CspD [Gammaproteobacteria bacterium]